MADKDGWVYVLTNDAMPGLVKVGQTYKTPEIRAQELSSESGWEDDYLSTLDAGDVSLSANKFIIFP